MSGKPLAYQYLMKIISVTVQGDNAVVMHGNSSPDVFNFIFNDIFFCMVYTSVRGGAVIYCMLAVTVTGNCILCDLLY